MEFIGFVWLRRGKNGARFCEKMKWTLIRDRLYGIYWIRLAQKREDFVKR
jgi:hypothetical protein